MAKPKNCCVCGMEIPYEDIYYRSDENDVYCATCFEENIMDAYKAEHEYCNNEDDE